MYQNHAFDLRIIQGYYTNYFHAKIIEKWCKNRGHTNISLLPYDKDTFFEGNGINECVKIGMGLE